MRMKEKRLIGRMGEKVDKISILLFCWFFLDFRLFRSSSSPLFFIPAYTHPIIPDNARTLRITAAAGT